MDALIFVTVAAAGLVGWIRCARNPAVHWLWRKVLIYPAVIVLALYIALAVFAIPMALWVGATIDRPVLAFALAPILAWPVRKREGAPAREVAAP